MLFGIVRLFTVVRVGFIVVPPVVAVSGLDFDIGTVVLPLPEAGESSARALWNGSSSRPVTVFFW